MVEGNTRISVAIKYLTQSTWSHAALYIGDALPPSTPWQLPPVRVEADLEEGVRAITLAHYAQMHTRICRPVGLNDEDRRRIVDYAIARIGQHYDLKNIFDLARYLLPISICCFINFLRCCSCALSSKVIRILLCTATCAISERN